MPSAEEWLERIEAQRLLVEFVSALEEPLRSTILLRYCDGLSAAEIARASGVPAGTVRSRLSERGRYQLGPLVAGEVGVRARVSAWVTMLLQELSATTAADGTFRLAGVIPGAPVTLMVRADPRRFAPRTQVVNVAAGEREVDAGALALEPVAAK